MPLTPAEKRLQAKLMGKKTPSGQEVLRQKLNTQTTSQQAKPPPTGMTTEEILERGRYLASTPTGQAAFGAGGERLYPTPKAEPVDMPTPKVDKPPVAKYDEAYLRNQAPLNDTTKKVVDDTTTKKDDDKQIDTDTKIANDTKDMTADWQTQFDDMMKKFETAQTDSQKKQADIFTKLGETANKDMLEKFEATQKSMSDAYESYFDEQSAYLKELQDQPSMVDQLKQFREEQGLPQMEKQLAGVDQTIMTTEGLLANIEEDIRTRTEGLPVSEAAARRLTAMEQKPLTKQMDELLRSRQRIATGLEAKERAVSGFMQAAQEDISKQREIAQTKLGFKKEEAEFKGDLTQQSFQMFTTLQDRMTDIHKLRLTAVQNEAEYKNKLAEMGFSFFSQRMAEQKADIKDQEAFEQQLMVEQMKIDLKAQNPEIKYQEDFTDREGNVTLVTTLTDGTIETTQIPGIGKAEPTTKAEIFDIGGEQIDLSTTAGIKQAVELGSSYSDIYSALDTETKLTTGAIKTLLKEAGVESPTEVEKRGEEEAEARKRNYESSYLTDEVRGSLKNDYKYDIQNFINDLKSERKDMTPADIEKAKQIYKAEQDVVKGMNWLARRAYFKL